MAHRLVQYEERGGIAHITLNRPDVLNALNDDLLKALRDAMFDFDADEDAQVAILSGAGTSFCSGADIKQRQLRPKEELAKLGSPQGRGAHIEESSGVLQLEARYRGGSRICGRRRPPHRPDVRDDRGRRGGPVHDP